VALKATHLLKDDPATADEFGTHNKIADLIRDEILGSASGRSIALIGDWGSGKSTIIELLKGYFTEGENPIAHLFIYDAWSHQGDSLRRAFLDDLIVSLSNRMTEQEVIDATDQVWNRTETTTTTTEPVLRRHAKALLLSLVFIPIGLKLFELPPKTGLLEGFEEGRNIVAYLLLLAPAIAVALFGLINWTRWTPVKDFLFGDSHKESGFSILSFFFEKVQGHVERRHIKTPADSIRAFRDVFSQLLGNLCKSRQPRIMI
jgi:predicted ABC-type transport system involved in lysophospholipase L1 biosynthesis ATPase subunit